ncbi:hypothetical protein A7C99_5575 [Trichophyton rubrum]|uniref:Uncharacterized protein n=1 Tax=Trichophyton rubrum TaxID=5551 RepID=A0A178ETR0_TRIRU|nr:hypothetical protein HL42_3074 [Trichophyton rubrum]OAL63186.1 hypothetical protein A7C99_5575 [Trichophyton rubrum]
MSFRCGLFYGLSPQTNAYSTIVNFNTGTGTGTGTGFKDQPSPQYCAIMSAFHHHLDLAGRRRLGALDAYERPYLSDEPKDAETAIIPPQFTHTPLVRSSTLSFSDSSVSSLGGGDLKTEVQRMLRETATETQTERPPQPAQEHQPQELLQSDGENGDDEYSEGTDIASLTSVDDQSAGGVEICHLPVSAEVHVDRPLLATDCFDEAEWLGDNDDDGEDDEDDEDNDEETEEEDDDEDEEDEEDDEEDEDVEMFDSDSDDASDDDNDVSVNGDDHVDGLDDEFSYISFSRSVHFAPALETVIPDKTYDSETEPPTEPLPEMTIHEKIQIALAAKPRSLDPANFSNDEHDEPDEHSRDHLDLDKQLLTAYINGLRTISAHVCKIVIRSRTLPHDPRAVEGVEPDTRTYVNEYLDRISLLLQNFFPNLVDEDKFDDILESTTMAVSFDDEENVTYRPGFTDARKMIQSALEETLDVDDMYMADEVTKWLASELIEPLGLRAVRLERN